MGWRLVQQPNGLLARFTTVVDDFTHYDLTVDEALIICTDEYNCPLGVAHQMVDAALMHPEWFEESLTTIRLINGEQTEAIRRKELGVSAG